MVGRHGLNTAEGNAARCFHRMGWTRWSAQQPWRPQSG